MMIKLVLLAGIAVVLAGCAGREFGSPTRPSPVLAFAQSADLAPGTPDALPLGFAIAADTACPAGSPAGARCVRMTVDCPTIPPASALLRTTQPSTGKSTRGTILLSTGGAGTALNGAIGLGPQMIRALIDEGMVAVEIAWDIPGIWGGPQARTLACRYATAARWVYENIHEGGTESLFAAQGTSGGASQVAFALAHYGLSEIIALANLGGGPPGCPQCSPDGRHGPEPLLPGAPPSVNREPQFVYPTTVVRFFVGANEPTPGTIADATAYYEAVMPLDKSMTIVPGTAHDIEATQAGVDAFVQSVRGALGSR